MKTDETTIPSPERIALLCRGLLGDNFFRVPSIEAIKKHFPNSRITVIADKNALRVLVNHPAIDEFVEMSSKNSQKRLLNYIIKTIKDVIYLRKQKFDLTINFYGGGSSPALMWLIRAKTRIGFNNTWKQRFSNTISVPIPTFCESWHKAFGTLLSPLGIESDEIRRGSSFFYSDSAHQFAKDLFSSKQGSFVAINLGTGDVRKCWPTAHFVSLAKRLYKDFQLVPVVFTNPGQEEFTESFVDLYGNETELVRLPLTPLDSEAAVMDQCQFVISGETALLHLSVALKKPSLGIFTYDRPEIVSPEDCLFIPVFKEDPNHLDHCGKPVGSGDLTVEEVYQGFCELRRLVVDSK